MAWLDDLFGRGGLESWRRSHDPSGQRKRWKDMDLQELGGRCVMAVVYVPAEAGR